MSIWVDADACPVVIREILIRAALRTGKPLLFVANSYLNLPKAKNISLLQVSQGYDAADNEIVNRAQAGDLVITSDLPLAAEVVEKGCVVVGHRGDAHTKENIKSRLNIRDFMETMRASGVQSGGPPALGPNERKKFAEVLDRYLARQSKS